MKKSFLFIIALIIAVVLNIFTVEWSAAEDIRVYEKVEGRDIYTFEVTTDGTCQAVTVPAGAGDAVYRHAIVQVHDGGTTTYTHIDSPVEFHFSSESDCDPFNYGSALEISIGKKAGDILGYFMAATGQSLVVTLER